MVTLLAFFCCGIKNSLINLLKPLLCIYIAVQYCTYVDIKLEPKQKEAYVTASFVFKTVEWASVLFTIA